jgi:hypothetical protein
VKTVGNHINLSLSAKGYHFSLVSFVKPDKFLKHWKVTVFVRIEHHEASESVDSRMPIVRPFHYDIGKHRFTLTTCPPALRKDLREGRELKTMT